jgi:hypothetical protein
MPHRHRSKWIVLVLVMAGLALSACKQEEEEGIDEPAKVEQIGSSEISKVTLESKAAERLDVHTASVTKQGGQKAIPYDAVLYDAEGATYVYVSPEEFVYQRAPIEVKRINGDVATLSKGPSVGTKVVTVGAQQIYGAEFGVGE